MRGPCRNPQRPCYSGVMKDILRELGVAVQSVAWNKALRCSCKCHSSGYNGCGACRPAMH
jgi:hypothetical protein